MTESLLAGALVLGPFTAPPVLLGTILVLLLVVVRREARGVVAGVSCLKPPVGRRMLRGRRSRPTAFVSRSCATDA